MSDHDDHTDSGNDSDDDPEYRLRETLKKNLVKSAFDKTNHPFVPEGVVDRLITREEVQRCLKISKTSAGTDESIEFVMTSAKKGFAIAIVAKIDVKRAIGWLKTESLDDKKLPITKPKSRSWSRGWRGDFCEHQWTFLAPVFDTTKLSHDFEEARILPFVSTSTVTGKGSFGEVSKTVIHREHLRPVSRKHLSGNWLLNHA